MKQNYLFAILFLFASNLLFAQSRNNLNYWDVMQDVSLKAKFNPITENFDNTPTFGKKIKKLDG